MRLDSASDLVRLGLALGLAAGTAVCVAALWRSPVPPPPLADEGAAIVATPHAPGPLGFPLEGVVPRLTDSFHAARSGGRTHRAIDLIAPRGTRVVAVADGRITRLSREGAGGIAVYQSDSTGRYTFYYAHLDGWAPGLAEGATVRRGETLGYVGTTGNAPARTPHLHFAAWEITDARSPSEGRPLNPFTFWRVDRSEADPG